MDLLDLDLDLETLLFPEAANDDVVEVSGVPPSPALRYLKLCHYSSANIYLHQPKTKDSEYHKYQPFLG